MSNFNKTLYIIAITAFSFFIIDELSSLWYGIDKEKKLIYEKDQMILNNLLKAQMNNVKILSNLLATNEFVIQGYTQNNPEIIKKHIGPIWNQVKNEKLTYEIHFFKPPAISFVNFSNFQSIGDDVSNVRKDIEWVTSSFKPSTHILMCKTYAGLRATDPIFDKNGTILGGLSLGKKIDWIPSELKNNSGHDTFLVYKKDATNSLMSKYYEDFIKNKILIGQYILADHTLSIPDEKILEINFSKPIQKISLHNKSYYLNSYPILDFNKEVMGYVCTLATLDQFYKDFAIHLLKTFLLVFTTAIIIFYISRKRTLEVLHKIRFIQKLTDKIKVKDFKILHTVIPSSNTDSLYELQNNILSMGLELEKSYNMLKEQNKEKDKKIFNQFYYDSLTSLPNRNKLFEDIKLNKDSYVALLDIKDFKQINDVFGFDMGNEILQEIAKTALTLCDERDYGFYRIGSDKFMLKNNALVSQEDFLNFLQMLMQHIENDIIHTKADINISVEIYAGVCFSSEDKLTKVEIALTKAKKSAKAYVVYNEDTTDKTTQTNNINMINKLKDAIENEHILVYYHGIVDKHEKLVKYEALVRMQDGEHVLSPFHFLEIAQKTKYYPSITKIIIEKTFKTLLSTDLRFSINLSASDILNEQTNSFIKESLKNCKKAKNVVFEILESEEIYNLSEIQNFIVEIKKLGARIAIDDFGTGYSNFSYLLKINPDIIKIDGSLIKNIDTDERAQKVVKSIITFAKESGIITVAEFVHSQEVFEKCKELGIDEFQGYLFHKPSPTI